MILVPDTTSGGAYAYRRYSATDLFGYNRRMLRETQNFGLAPLHFIVQRGPYQDGDTALDMRLDPRVIRLVIAETLYRRDDYWDRRNDVLDLLRPNRSFDGTVRPLVYQKWLPAGKIERGNDLVTTAWSTTVTSATGRFVERGLSGGRHLRHHNGQRHGAGDGHQRGERLYHYVDANAGPFSDGHPLPLPSRVGAAQPVLPLADGANVRRRARGATDRAVGLPRGAALRGKRPVLVQ